MYILLAAPPGPIRQHLAAFFEAQGAHVDLLNRETIITAQQVVIEDERILLEGRDILDHRDISAAARVNSRDISCPVTVSSRGRGISREVKEIKGVGAKAHSCASRSRARGLTQRSREMTGPSAAIILDSGYMWQLPMLDPSVAEWELYADHFDDFLRNERESASFWYSLLQIINDRFPVSINRQEAFANAALKPDAPALLEEKGLPTAPCIISNDPEALTQFSREHPGFFYKTPLVPGGSSAWLNRTDLDALIQSISRAPEPVQLQAFASTTPIRVMALGGEVLAQYPPTEGDHQEARQRNTAESTSAHIVSDAPHNALATISELTAPIQKTLEIEWADLLFGRTPEGWRLADFSPTPALDRLPAHQSNEVLERLFQHIQTLWEALR